MVWWHFVGMVGVTLIVSKGKVFDGVRRYLAGFARWYNPLRWVGMAMLCPMCSGFWVGAVSAVLFGHGVLAAFLLGGCVSLASWIAGCAVVWFEHITEIDRDDEDEPVGDGAGGATVLDGIRKMREQLGWLERRVEDRVEEGEVVDV
jgi:hypothetical protein